jgi:hypothetical protein
VVPPFWIDFGANKVSLLLAQKIVELLNPMQKIVTLFFFR